VEEETLKILKAVAVGLVFASPAVAVLYSASPYLAASLALGLAVAGLLIGVLVFNPGAFLKALSVGATCAGIAAFIAYPFSALMAAPASLVLFIIGIFLGLVITGPGASFVTGSGLFSILMMGTGFAIGARLGYTAGWVAGLFVLAAVLALYLPPLPNFQRALLATLVTGSLGITGALLGYAVGLPDLLPMAFLSCGAFFSLLFKEEGSIGLAFHSVLASLMMGLGFIAGFFSGYAHVWVPLLFVISVMASVFLYRARLRLLMLLVAPADILAALAYLVGAAFRAPLGPVVIALVLAADLDIPLYLASDTFMLWLNRAKVVTEAKCPRAYSLVRRPAAAANLPVPRIAVVQSEAVNLFSVGRSPGRAVIALTQGLLDSVSDDELEALMAHELAHVKDRDLLPMTIACALAVPAGSAVKQLVLDGDKGIGLPSRVFIAVIAPFFALMLHLSLPRAREKRADSGAVLLTKKGEALASALEKLDKASGETPLAVNPATRPLFAVDPFRDGWLPGLFATHPPVEERIDLLRQGGAPVREGPAQATPPKTAPAPAGGH